MNTELDRTISFQLGDVGVSYQLTFLGAGSAFTIGDGNFQSNLLFTCYDPKLPGGCRRMLLDCGGDIRFSLAEEKLTARDIQDIYISHPHADHIGGLEYVAFSTHWLPNHPKPNLIIHRSLVYDLWSRSLAGGLESLEGEEADLDTYFNVQKVGRKGQFVWCGITFELIQVVHIMNKNTIVPSWGLRFEVNGSKVFWTSDTQHNPNQIQKFYDYADLILHDCETAQFPSKVHAHYSELKELDAETKAKMLLYHYQPGPKPDCVADGFKGWAYKGMSLCL